MRLLLSLVFLVSVSTAFAADEVASPAASDKAAAATTNEENTAVKIEDTASQSVPKVDNRKESDIPVNLDDPKKAAAEGSGVFRVIMTLAILGLVGTGAFIFLRKYSVPRGSKNQTQIKVLQQHYLGPKKSLAIIRVAGESMLIGVTDHNINMIKSLSLLDDEIPDEESAPSSFGRVLQSKGASFRDERDEDNDDDQNPKPPRGGGRQSKQFENDEEFAISGIKDIVSKRLKGMRSFQ